MQKQMAAGIAAFSLLVGIPLMAQEPVLAEEDAAEKLDELEAVVIVGGYVTPKMWKVSKGDHVMWVLGDASAPAGAKWRFEQAEALLAESQLLMYPGRLDADIGFFKVIGLVTLVPSAFKAAKNPDNKTLKDVLPPEMYERWRVLKNAYAPRDNDLERWRPSIAMGMLEGKIREQIGGAQPRSSTPPPGPALRPLVDKAAKKHKVKVRTMRDVERKIEVKNARGMLKTAGGLDLVDLKCIPQKLEYLERMIDYLERQASGTAPEKAPARVSDCSEADLLIRMLRSGEIPDKAGILKTMENMELQEKLGRQQLEAEWLAAAETALARNKSTFAMLPMYQLRSATGHLAKLRELGYTVEEPQ
jgi:hypothetical protein